MEGAVSSFRSVQFVRSLLISIGVRIKMTLSSRVNQQPLTRARARLLRRRRGSKERNKAKVWNAA